MLPVCGLLVDVQYACPASSLGSHSTPSAIPLCESQTLVASVSILDINLTNSHRSSIIDNSLNNYETSAEVLAIDNLQDLVINVFTIDTTVWVVAKQQQSFTFLTYDPALAMVEFFDHLDKAQRLNIIQAAAVDQAAGFRSYQLDDSQQNTG